MPFILPSDCCDDKQLINMQPMVLIGDRCDAWINSVPPFAHKPIQATIENIVKIEQPEPVLMNATLVEVNGTYEWKYDYNLEVLANMEPKIKLEKPDSDDPLWEYDGYCSSTTNDSNDSVKYKKMTGRSTFNIPSVRSKRLSNKTRKQNKPKAIHNENYSFGAVLKNYTTRSGRRITMRVDSD